MTVLAEDIAYYSALGVLALAALVVIAYLVYAVLAVRGKV